MYEVSVWGHDAQIPLEAALQLKLPAQRCHVYRIDVGGDAYIGMTTLTPEIALSKHIEHARNGSATKIHAALRRFGYLSNVTTLSTHDGEIECLVAKVCEIHRLKPVLNSTVGGEGYRLNLVEKTNIHGEKIFYVENKEIIQRNIRIKERASLQRPNLILEKINRRYDEFEKKLPSDRRRYADELWKVSISKTHFGSNYSASDVKEYFHSRKRRYETLSNWSNESQLLVEAHERLKEFLENQNFKLLTKSNEPFLKRKFATKSKDYSYTPTYERGVFNSDFFIGIKRVFFAQKNSTISSLNQVFYDEHDAREWLIKQSWFQQSIRNGIIQLEDAFFPFMFDLGQYGGFLGLFTKQNIRAGYVKVDAAMLRLHKI
jgi:hypothetical protein